MIFSFWGPNRGMLPVACCSLIYRHSLKAVPVDYASDRDYRVRRISSSVVLAAGAWAKKPTSFSQVP